MCVNLCTQNIIIFVDQIETYSPQFLGYGWSEIRTPKSVGQNIAKPVSWQSTIYGKQTHTRFGVSLFPNERRLAVDIQHIWHFGPRASLAAVTGVITPTLLSFALYSGVLGADWKVRCRLTYLPSSLLSKVKSSVRCSWRWRIIQRGCSSISWRTWTWTLQYIPSRYFSTCTPEIVRACKLKLVVYKESPTS